MNQCLFVSENEGVDTLFDKLLNGLHIYSSFLYQYILIENIFTNEMMQVERKLIWKFTKLKFAVSFQPSGWHVLKHFEATTDVVYWAQESKHHSI